MTQSVADLAKLCAAPAIHDRLGFTREAFWPQGLHRVPTASHQIGAGPTLSPAGLLGAQGLRGKG